MNFKVILAIFGVVSLQQLVAGQAWSMNFQSDLLENQLKAIEREQKSIAERIIQSGVYQVENAGKLLQASSSVQQSVGNARANKGINDLNDISRSILSSNVRQCFETYKFKFADAINMARSMAMQCITDKVNKGKAIVDGAVQDIQNTVQNIGNVGQLINQCRESSSSLPFLSGVIARFACLTQAMITMKSEAILLPINLGRRGADASAEISSIQSDIMKCNLDILLAIVTQATKSGDAIIKCMSGNESERTIQQGQILTSY